MSKSAKDIHLKSPLKEFANNDLLKCYPKIYTDQLINTANSALIAEHHNDITSELLSVQAELLIKSRTTDPSYENLILSSTPIYNKEGTRIDCYDSSVQSINICPNNTRLKLGEVLVHEMTHAIDDIYDDRKSGDRVLATLKFKSNGETTDTTFQKNTIELVSQTLPPDIQTTFRISYHKPAIQGSVSFTTICESAERKAQNGHSNLTRQEKAASVLLGEFSAFTFESLFSELQQDPTTSSKFLENYSKLNPAVPVAMASERRSARLADLSSLNEDQEIKNTAQEVIAVSIFAITKHMINHIESSLGKVSAEESKISSAAEGKASVTTSEEMTIATKLEARGTLLIRLQEVQRTIAPAYERALGKISLYETSRTASIDAQADPKEATSRKKDAFRIHDQSATALVASMKQRSSSFSGSPSNPSSPGVIRNLPKSKSESSLLR